MTIGHRTNAIYRELVGQALDLEIDVLTLGGEKFGDRRIASVFGGDGAVVRELSALRDWNDSADHYVLGAYHNALLNAVLPDQIESINEAYADQEPMVFCGDRYVVRGIDMEAFLESFFEDIDFALPPDRVNELSPAEKALLGIDDAVFGVANALEPHPDELLPRVGSPNAVEQIIEIVPAVEERLRRRHRAAPEAVWDEVADKGPLYRRGEVFPYWPTWLTGGVVGSEGES